MFQYEAKIKRVVDGDTLVMMIDLGFNVHTETSVRLARINTPEEVKYTLGGLDDPARAFVLERCFPGSTVIVNISRKEKYGRWLADVFYKMGSVDRYEIASGGTCLNDELVAQGLAVFYDGGKR